MTDVQANDAVAVRSAQPAHHSVPSRLPSLTGLRFPAALMVFFYHSSLLIPTIAVFGYTSTGMRYGAAASNAGAFGVSFFFVLSGFVLTWSARAQDTPKAFWRRRFVKIYPNYVVAWVLAMVLFAGATTPAWRAILNLFMLQVWVPDFFTNFSVDPPSWSLGAEAVFYASFPLLLHLVRRIDLARLKFWIVGVVAGIVATPLLAYALLPSTPNVPGGYLASPLQYFLAYILPPVRLLDFALGVLIARAVLTGRWRNIGMVPAGILLIGSYVLTQYVPYLYAQRAVCVVPFALLIASAATADVRGRRTWLRNRVMTWLGEVSFAFYLLHFIVITVVLKYTRSLLGVQYFSTPAGIAVLLGTLVIAVGLSSVLYVCFERPITRRWSSRQRAPEQATTSAG
ncbi:MAG TPA: acyltransferase [Pseudonocardiaceae bacterium]|nr:acyltransferase [Pseudonocardiaceae bacterium]